MKRRLSNIDNLTDMEIILTMSGKHLGAYVAMRTIMAFDDGRFLALIMDHNQLYGQEIHSLYERVPFRKMRALLIAAWRGETTEEKIR